MISADLLGLLPIDSWLVSRQRSLPVQSHLLGLRRSIDDTDTGFMDLGRTVALGASAQAGNIKDWGRIFNVGITGVNLKQRWNAFTSGWNGEAEAAAIDAVIEKMRQMDIEVQKDRRVSKIEDQLATDGGAAAIEKEEAALKKRIAVREC